MKELKVNLSDVCYKKLEFIAESQNLISGLDFSLEDTIEGIIHAHYICQIEFKHQEESKPVISFKFNS
ncbi:hypothetical protein [Bacillus sp. CHD6a]|uniref:hypothetical protein n=1 Tax=Bacillus sp. CHD6a TaxID=1643452 RepID=UPI0006CDCABE|nr:hypothetical protein [Bacillus sp. CHD6a]KPB06317.1 hypothetical protein AAV98_00480 [Bacillus sp. CHD6a]